MKKRPSAGKTAGSGTGRKRTAPRSSSGKKLRNEQLLRLEAETLNALALEFAAEFDLQALLQKVTDAATRLSAAKFGAFFYNDLNERGESYLLFTLSGAPREAFEKIGMPRKTPLFGPTFRGEGAVRIDDVLEDRRYGKNPPHHGMPEGHLPVRSYLAVPVKSRAGEVLGGLFFGHPEPGVFTEHAERLILGIAAQAAIAIDNARLYAEARREIHKRKQAERALRATERRLEAVLETINDHLVSYDLQWRYTYVNDRAASVLGRPKEELLGKCIWDLFPDAIGNQYYNELHQALAEQRVIRSEHYYEPFATWFENHIYPYADGVTVFSADITWRKNAEQALRDSEQRFARFMQNLPGLAWIKDARGRYVYANDAAEKVFRISRDRLYGRTDAEVFPPAIAAQFRENDLRALESGSGIETVEILPHSDGVAHHSIVSKFPIFDETGKAVLIGGIAIDITERKNAELALQESEARFRMMANATPSLIWTADPDGAITFLSDRWFEYSGLERRGQVRDRPNILHPGDIERREQVWRTALRDGTPYEIEVRMRRHDGEYRWFISRAVPMRDETGRIKGWFGSSTDIHDRKLAELALQESETRFRLMANTTPSIIWTAAPDGAITFSSDRWFEYTGISRERNVRDWPDVLHPDDLERCTREWSAALRNGTPYEIEVRNRRHDGEYRWFITRAMPIHDETGAIKCWFGSSTDIHDRKMAEEALKEADRRKDRFLAILAHELRNPLAPIRNSLHLLRMPIDSGSIKHVHEMMERQVNHMVRLVDDLMEVSRITRGQIELRKAPLDLAAVIQSAVETSRPLIEEAGHHLEVSLPSDPVPLHADLVRLAQVFSNLLNNAAKYTEHGGFIWLTAWREKDLVIVSVRDNGIGISAEALPHVFDMLSRPQHNTRGGLGVGLTLARSLVQMHGGGIEARSAGTGRGSEFIVRLPLAPRAQPEPIPPASVAGARTALSILVVDDNHDAADSLCMLLRFLGHTVQVVHDGPSALAAVETHRPGVVLLDLGMPGMDGYEVARRIREQPEFNDIALIALTGWGQEEDRRRAQAEGFNRHLVKPVDLNVLQELLASLGD